MTRFSIKIHRIRPSGHRLKVYDAEFGCKNAGHHLDILKFLEQLETRFPDCMEIPT